MVELDLMESKLPNGSDIIYFSGPSLFYLPAVPRCFKDANLERGFIERHQKTISRRLLVGIMLVLLYLVPRTIMDLIYFERGIRTQAALFELSSRALGVVLLAMLACLIYLRPTWAGERSAIMAYVLVFVWIFTNSKHRCSWLFQETTQDAFGLTVNSDSLIMSPLMCSVSGFFICIPVRVSHSWVITVTNSLLYLAFSLPIQGLEQNVTRILALGVLLGLLAWMQYFGKVWTETSDRTNYAWQVTLKREIIEERVLRYSAEHKAESGPFAPRMVEHQTDASSVADSQRSSSQTLLSEVSSRKPRSAPSVCMTAHGNYLSEQCHRLCASGDCVTMHHLVQTPAGREEVGSLSVGQQVLCLDHLTAMQRFVEVSDVQSSRRRPDVPVAKVVLEDGSSVEATLDHPMPAHLGDSSAQWQAIPAGRLQPGLHSLICTKQVSLGIASVDVQARDQMDPEETLVALSVRQPDRFAILMARSGMTSMVGVGSVCMNSITYRHKNTFIECALESEPGEVSKLKRSRSCPELQMTCSSDAFAKLVSSSPRPLDSEAVSIPIPISQQKPDRSKPPPPGSGALCLPPLSVMQEKHAAGRCKPCRFHRRYKSGKPGAEPCSAGDNCRLCHFEGH
eukprot:TRINITY_DN43126_c0_g1_i1.p1 TRINITY_DN43126_c0_g1~~TRINITY_DN43126_c0_g1_i1.p1  ORF type:complete len:643 (+),score=45.21 TRINITY_DN43126_c0_g1_i1:62-1930(+)